MKQAFLVAVVAGLMFAGDALAPLTLSAQEEIAPLILDERPGMTIRTRPRRDREGEEATPAVPTPAPSDVIVAVVNSHRLTREALDVRVAERFSKYKEELERSEAGRAETIRDVFGRNSEAARIEILNEVRENIDNARRTEEGEAVREWVEHFLLADEARRQGVMIDQNEFRARLSELTVDSGLSDERVGAVLEDLRISRRDFQQSLYDAMLIERLIETYIRRNWSEARLRELYEANRALFIHPERFHIAHFSIALDGSETNEQISRLEDLARRVRSELRNGVDPEELFARAEFNRLEMGIWGGTGYYTFYERALPAPVEVEARRLRVGQTSDVMVNRMRDHRDRIRPRSLHVIRVLGSEPRRGDTFESALPDIHRSLIEVARTQLLERIRSAGSHRVITNLGGIPPTILPSADDIERARLLARPINLTAAP